jgi:TetR/AcrR family transcriptional repressor of nem operon
VARTESEKRARLIAAAQRLFHEHGVEATTLADVAAAADVPPGNVYYYFKTKRALVEAVIAAHTATIQEDFARWEHAADPGARLRLLLREMAAADSAFARVGCPYGGLCQELGKLDPDLAAEAAELLRLYLDWAERQYRLLGKGDAAADLAAELIASLQGTILLTYALHDPALLTRHVGRLEARLDATL